jgi:hypothetical protein
MSQYDFPYGINEMKTTSEGIKIVKSIVDPQA